VFHHVSLKSLVIVAVLAAGLVPALAPGRVFAAGPALASSVTGNFYVAPPLAITQGRFVPPTQQVFTEQFHAIDFNPGSPPCSTNVGVFTKPFTNVVPNYSTGFCSLEVAQGNGYQAGVNFPSPSGVSTAFEATFSSSYSVVSPGSVTFQLTGDDGWVLGFGPSGANQPTGSVGNPMVNPLPASFEHNYPVVAASNQWQGPFPYNVTVNFPAAGTYPLEIDYAENGTGSLSMVFANAAGQALAYPLQPSASTKELAGRNHGHVVVSLQSVTNALGHPSGALFYQDGRSAHTVIVNNATFTTISCTSHQSVTLLGRASYNRTTTVSFQIYLALTSGNPYSPGTFEIQLSTGYDSGVLALSQAIIAGC
jgi:hypothetical protein